MSQFLERLDEFKKEAGTITDALSFKKFRDLDPKKLQEMKDSRIKRFDKFIEDLQNHEKVHGTSDASYKKPEFNKIVDGYWAEDRKAPTALGTQLRALKGPAAAYGSLGALGTLGYKYLRRGK